MNLEKDKLESLIRIALVSRIDRAEEALILSKKNGQGMSYWEAQVSDYKQAFKQFAGDAYEELKGPSKA